MLLLRLSTGNVSYIVTTADPHLSEAIHFVCQEQSPKTHPIIGCPRQGLVTPNLHALPTNIYVLLDALPYDGGAIPTETYFQ